VPNTAFIVTHVNPDWDALTSAWLLSRFHPKTTHAQLVFVTAKNPPAELLSAATAVVDVGLAYDPNALRFDHHQDDFTENLSATGLVFKHLKENGIANNYFNNLAHIEPIVKLVNNIDMGDRGPEAEFSFQFGIHALLSAERYRLSTMVEKENLFSETARWAFGILDLLCEKMSHEAKQRIAFESKMVFRSEDNKFCAARGTNDMTVFSSGADVALIMTDGSRLPTGGITYPLTLSRAPGKKSPNIAELVESILAQNSHAISPTLRDELTRWWKHPAGFYAGRGTPKAPCEIPITVDFLELAKLINDAWKR
jgi:hypothetical protein